MNSAGRFSQHKKDFAGKKSYLCCCYVTYWALKHPADKAAQDFGGGQEDESAPHKNG
jgi:hypothetical protein